MTGPLRRLGGGPGRAWPVVLTSGPVTLRPLHGDDAAAWTALREVNHSWLSRWEATAPPGAVGARPASFPAMVRRLRRSARAGSTFPFVIEVDGVLAGQLTVSNIVRGSGQFASVGYWIGERFAGRGVVPRAVALAIDHCFFTAGLHRIEVSIRPENANSLRVVEKLGIPEVGYAPRYLHIDGAWRDHRVFAITIEDAPEGVLGRLAAP